MIDLDDTKLLASVVLFLATLACGYLPVKIILHPRFVGYAMFGGGGVLMATAFCHLIPETHDHYREYLESLKATVTSEAIDCLQDRAACNESFPSHDHDHDHEHGHDHEHVSIPEVFIAIGFFFMYIVEFLMLKFISNHSHGLLENDEASELTNNISIADDVPDKSKNQQTKNVVLITNTNELQTQVPVDNFDTACSPSPTLAKFSQPPSQVKEFDDTNTNTHNNILTLNQHDDGKQQKSSGHVYKFLRGLLIVSAFGAHSIFEGVSIGSQNTDKKVWTLVIAIACHKLIIAAVVGLELYAATNKSHLWTLIHLSIFSIMSPIGIMLMVIAQSAEGINEKNPSMILLQSFATGTLLYIVFVEILQPKRPADLGHKGLFGKILSMLAGFTLMLLVLTFLSGEE